MKRETPMTHAKASSPPVSGDPAWQWPEQTIFDIVHTVRAGKDLTPRHWPDGASAAVGLSFDVDNETLSLKDGHTSPALMAQGEYGARAGTPRILALLDRFQIPATFFTPAMSTLLHPQSIDSILTAGRHEIGLHGWIHERNSGLAEVDERDLMRRSVDTLTRLTGKTPVGLRTSSWDFSPATLSLIMEFGLLYDSSLMADDRPYELLYHGAPTGVVELPVEWILDDYPYFAMERHSSVRPHLAPSDVFDIWQAEFDMACNEGALFILTMHPHIIGHRSRIGILERLLQYMQSSGKVWFATHEQIARYVSGGM